MFLEFFSFVGNQDWLVVFIGNLVGFILFSNVDLTLTDCTWLTIDTHENYCTRNYVDSLQDDTIFKVYCTIVYCTFNTVYIH